MNRPLATVYIIGAGPGDPGLLTLRGRDCLARADVVLYDYLAGTRLLELARADAQLYCLGRHGQGKLWSQQDINQRMVDQAKAGRTVARLKGGDPGVFGRLAEETAALSAAGVPFEIVPGVTTAAAAGAYAGVTVTHRDQASSVAFVTGQEQAGKADSSLDYAALANFPGTLVFYMGVTTAEYWSSQLITNGKPADTPVVLVRRCSLPDQTTLDTTLGEVAKRLASNPTTGDKIRPPLVAIVGQVARREEISNWFTNRPLFGQTVLVTRPEQQATDMTNRLRNLGAEVLVQPAITIDPPSDWSQVDAAIGRLGDFDAIVFSSRNGVSFFFHRLKELGYDARALGGIQTAAIGPHTALALKEHSVRTDFSPDEYRAEALAERLAQDARGKRFLLIRASRGREILSEQLRAAGGEVEQVVVYQSHDVQQVRPEIAEAMAAGRVDWTTATSSAIARSLLQLFGDDLHQTKLAAISPLTASVLCDAGLQPAAVAAQYTAEGVVDALLHAATQ